MTPAWLTAPILAMFGTATDAEIADAAGVTVHAVRRARVVRGLPSRPRGQPCKGRVTVEVSLRPETLAAIDAAKGERTRGEVIDAYVAGSRTGG